MTDISPDTEDITDKANTLTVEVGQDQRSDWGTTVDTSAQWWHPHSHQTNTFTIEG
jgi:hypothetical protein